MRRASANVWMRISSGYKANKVIPAKVRQPAARISLHETAVISADCEASHAFRTRLAGRSARTAFGCCYQSYARYRACLTENQTLWMMARCFPS